MKVEGRPDDVERIGRLLNSAVQAWLENRIFEAVEVAEDGEEVDVSDCTVTILRASHAFTLAQVQARLDLDLDDAIEASIEYLCKLKGVKE